MKNGLRLLAGGAAATLAVALGGCSATEETETQTVRLGVVPTETLEATLAVWSTFYALFEEETGMQLELFEATNVAPVVEATIAGDLDLIMLGPFAQVLARDNGAEIETVGYLIDTPEDAENTSVGLSLADGGVKDIADLAGKDVCFVDPGSASGYLFPAAGFLDEGIDPEEDLNALFVGDHISAVDAMVAGECEAVFTYSANDVYVSAPDDFNRFWQEEVPNPGFSISKELDSDTRQVIVDAMLKINGDLADERGLCTDENTVPGPDGPVCQALGASWGVVAADDSYWESLRWVCEKTKAPACEE